MLNHLFSGLGRKFAAFFGAKLGTKIRNICGISFDNFSDLMNVDKPERRKLTKNKYVFETY